MTEYSVDDVRARFEAWAKDERGYTELEVNGLRDGDNYLHNCDLYLAWKAWQKVSEIPADASDPPEMFHGTRAAIDGLCITHNHAGKDHA